ncbi:MAG: ABC transporter permease [Planctomycetota bacterium]|nr:MAG: ABC transporter permease [Planctomycetota bacterium]
MSSSNAQSRFLGAFGAVGAYLIDRTQFAGYALVLAYRSARWIPVPSEMWKRRGFIIRQMHSAGIESLPVTLIVAIFIGFLLSLSAGVELKRYGQQAIVGQLVAVSVVREFGPFMTGLILAANVGSSMAAELGTMKVSEEIDALEVMSIDPARFLVLPRLVAMMVMTPLLTVFSDIVAIIGGGIIAMTQLGVGWPKYYQNVLEGLAADNAGFPFYEGKHIYTGLLKALVFGITIAVVSCSEGLRTTGGAVGVGRATRRSVILCYLLVLVFGYFGTSLFYGKSGNF